MAFELYDEELDAELFAVAIADPSTEVLNLIGQTPEACARQLLARHQPDRLQTLKEDGPILSYVGFTVQRRMIQRLPLRGPLDDLLELIQSAREDLQVSDVLHTRVMVHASMGTVGAQELLDLITFPVTSQDWNGWSDVPEDFDDMLAWDPASLLPDLKPEVRHRVILAMLFSLEHDVHNKVSRPRVP